jgi:hypothetical protein
LMTVERSPKGEQGFPAAGLATPGRCSRQQNPNNFKFLYI